MTKSDGPIDITHALEEVTVPAYVIDRDGRFRWLNRGAIALFGMLVGKRFTHAVAPEDLHLARTEFAKKIIGESGSTDFTLTVVASDGRRVPVRINSVPLWEGGDIVGVFGLAYPGDAVDGGARRVAPSAPQLTARQYEVLAHLADGLGTVEIAARLGVAEETARNHLRGLFRELDVHSRLEAVVRAYRLGLLEPRRNSDG